MGRPWVVLPLTIVFLLLGLPALAQSQPAEPVSTGQSSDRILLVGPQGLVAMRRLGAELSGDGWQVVRVAPSAAPNESLEGVYSARAVLRAASDSVQVWIAPEGRRTAYSELIRSSGDEDVLAMRAVEVLRAHLLAPSLAPSARLRPANRASITPMDESANSLVDSGSDPNFWVQITPGGSFSPGGLGVRSQLALSGELLFNSHWSATLAGSLPLWSTVHSEREGSADVRPYVFWADGAWAHSTGSWRLGGAAGAGLVWIRAEGLETSADFVSNTESSISVAPIARSFAEYGLAPALALRADAVVGASLQRTEVVFAERRAFLWGRPFLLFGVGLRLGL